MVLARAMRVFYSNASVFCPVHELLLLSMAHIQADRGSQAADEGPRSPYVNLRKQTKYVLIGGSGVWYWQVYLHLKDAVYGPLWSR